MGDESVSTNEMRQIEDEISSLSFLLSELRAQEVSHLNGTSTEPESNPAQEGETNEITQDPELQALLEELEKLHGFADNVEDRMDTLLEKLDDMLGALEPGEVATELEGESVQPNTSPKQDDAQPRGNPGGSHPSEPPGV